MGYETEYTVEAIHGNIDLDAELRAGTKYEYWDKGKIRAKWYEWEEDMLKLSKLFPSILFKVDGEGEEAGDIWRAFFKNGKRVKYKAEIRLPHFSPDDLK